MKVLAFFAAISLSLPAFANLNYAGDYSGKFEGRTGTLRITQVGMTVDVEFIGTDGSNDILGNGCGSEIGALASIDTDTDNGLTKIDSATFLFDAGSCLVRGGTLHLDFKHKNGAVVGIEADIYKDSVHVPGQCFPDGSGRMSCLPDTLNHIYLMGSFKKQ